jgi:hypothetical protein
MARSPTAGALVSYYAFPFLIAMAWPLLAVRSQMGEAPETTTPPIAGFVSLLVLSFVPSADLHNPGRLPLPRAFLEVPSLAQQIATDRAVAAVSAAQSQLGRLLVDDSVAALDPRGFTKDEILFGLDLDKPAHEIPSVPDAVVFLVQGYDSKRLSLIARNAGLAYRYVVHGTTLHVRTRNPLKEVPGLGEILSTE